MILVVIVFVAVIIAVAMTLFFAVLLVVILATPLAFFSWARTFACALALLCKQHDVTDHPYIALIP